ncbi:hypothetical protein NT01EI_3082 [Edwardsiella ictaluri 93-146]|uniref:Uncharacterized protein n=1 Tax=Edwardsiella ictaluri (strain 93-146) TaxID=634503 RepID=C5BAM5_EDWI9|nr:hypothetical protein NT01EI_3082 [Edwardsiella ictaluri 93-146]
MISPIEDPFLIILSASIYVDPVITMQEQTVLCHMLIPAPT